LLLLLAAPALWAGESAPVKPGPKDKCPVCGMFVAKYPDWIAAVIFKDGSPVFFDGVKDMMKYHFNMAKYAPGRTPADIRAVQVTDYYRLDLVDGGRAFYVAGSDVYGPMGRELIPFDKEANAQEFMKDHRGTAVLTYEQIDPTIVNTLD
jgi:nitrous oxide reductase accessory protein NosL